MNIKWKFVFNIENISIVWYFYKKNIGGRRWILEKWKNIGYFIIKN